MGEESNEINVKYTSDEKTWVRSSSVSMVEVSMVEVAWLKL